MANITPARKLFDLLVSRDFDPEMLDSSGKPANDPSETEIFSFDFRATSGKDYGTVVIMLGDSNELEVYCSDNVGRGMEGSDKNDWFSFLEQLKNFATRNFMSFGIKNLNRLRYSMQGQAAIKEGLFESWSGKKDVSWNAGANESRLMIKHKRSLGEGEARFRYVESLFIETVEGERYKLPFKNLTAGKAMLEHVRMGGRPYDERGQHIAEMVTELSVLSRFRRANNGRLLEGDTASLVEQTNAYYENLQHNLKSLTTRRGYETYFESWSPSDITEESVVIEGLKHLFVTQSIDQRIEDALPLIAKIQQQENAMKEANIFEAWVEQLSEGTWQTPDNPEKQMQLIELMSQELPVGADATNATEQLYDLLGDDQLFDQLEALAERDANADARQVVLDRMQELSDNPDIRKVIEQLNIDADVEMNPPDATPADLEPMNENVTLDEDGSTLTHITNTFKRDVKDFLAGGDMSQSLYDALYDYYHEDMPYGTKKARDGDPHEWVADRFAADMGVEGAGHASPSAFGNEDHGMERESVGGDYADEKGRIQELAGLAPIAARVVGSVVADKIGQAMSNDQEVDEGAMKDVDIMRQDARNMNDVQFIKAHGMTKGQFKEKYKDLLKDEANPGVTPADIDGVNEEWYAHDFNQWQSDANAKGLDIVKSESDETGNNLQAFNAVDASGSIVGHFDGNKGSGVLTNTPSQYQQAVAVDEGFSQNANDAYTKDVVGYSSGASGAKELAKMGNPLDEDKCNMTEAGESCPVHGMNECGSGYSAIPAMETAPDPMLSRLKTLAAIMVK
jgi:hypothetical protein